MHKIESTNDTKTSVDSTFRQLVSILKEIPSTADATETVLRQEYVKTSNPVLCELRNDLFRESTNEALARKIHEYISTRKHALVSELANQPRDVRTCA